MKRVLVTRPLESLTAYAAAARACGWEAIELPLLRDEESRAWLASLAGHMHHPWLSYQSHLDPADLARLGWPIQSLPQSTSEASRRILDDPERYVDELPELVVLALPEPRVLRSRVGPSLMCHDDGRTGRLGARARRARRRGRARGRSG